MSSRSDSAEAESLLSEHEHEHEESVVSELARKMEARAEHQKTKHYQTIYSFATSIGVGLVILLLFWILHYRNGFAWQSQPAQQFYWHPLFMVLGMVVLYSQSMLTYRTCRNAPKRRLKLLHAALHGLAFVLSVIGLKAVFDSHNLATPPVPNLYTLHSWIGLTTIIIFSGQFLFGFVVFLYPGLSKSIRQMSMPVHTAVGTAGFVLAIVATVTGLTEKTIWALSKNYSNLPSEGVVLNFMGMFTVLYGVLVLYLVTESTYKRLALPDDEIALTGTD